MSLLKRADELGLQYFLVSFADLAGVSRAKLVPKSAIGEVEENGAPFAGFATWLDLTPADPDIFAKPDPASLIQLPWKPTVGCQQCFAVFPVDFKLPVRVLMVVLIGLPVESNQSIADLGNQIETAHQGLLVIARFGLFVARIRNRLSVGSQKKELTFHSRAQFISALRSACQRALQHDARGLRQGVVVHPQVGGEPADRRFPGELNE